MLTLSTNITHTHTEILFSNVISVKNIVYLGGGGILMDVKMGFALFWDVTSLSCTSSSDSHQPIARHYTPEDHNSNTHATYGSRIFYTRIVEA